MHIIFLLRSVFLLVVLFGLAGCTQKESLHSYKLEGRIMGTSYAITIVSGEPKSTTSLAELHQKVKSKLQLVDTLMSTYKAQSEVSKFNQLEAGKEMEISPETSSVLKYSKDLYEQSGGYFDVTVSPLVDLWGFGANSEPYMDNVPSKMAIEKVSRLVGSEHFSLSNDSISKHSEVRVDLSAIAKGFAVDLAAQALNQSSIKNYLVEVGGEIAVKGNNSKGKIWALGIEQPDFIGRKAHTIMNITNMSLATSGDYRNYYELQGQRYSHTINPKTYSPVKHQLASVSVLSKSCMNADALATTLMSMGEITGYQFALDNNIQAFFIYRVEGGYASKSTHGFEQFLN